MPLHKYRVLLLSSHPVQYAVPAFRRMSMHPDLDVLVAYCSLQGAERTLDPEFGVELAWDIPLLEGYPWLYTPNRSPCPGLGRFLGLINPDLYYLIQARRFDAIIIFTGYLYASFWIALLAAKLTGAAVLFGTDAHILSSTDQKYWKKVVKKWLWPHLFRLADINIVPSSRSAALLHALHFSQERIVLTPYVVDNDWWQHQVAQVNYSATRAQWNIPPNDVVVLFCAKLQPWKRPQDVLLAFARANVPHSWLVYAGEGAMHKELEEMAQALHVAHHVRFLGFVNQTGLPAVYNAANVLVLPSSYDAFGVVVNEAMLCGCPAIVSDQVGAQVLVQPDITGFIYPCGDLDRLTTLLRELLPDPARLQEMGGAAKQWMENWSPQENLAALVQAVKKAVALKQGRFSA